MASLLWKQIDQYRYYRPP